MGEDGRIPGAGEMRRSGGNTDGEGSHSGLILDVEVESMGSKQD